MIYNKGGRHKSRIAAHSLTRKRYTINEKVRFVTTVDTMVADHCHDSEECVEEDGVQLLLITVTWNYCYMEEYDTGICYKEFVVIPG